MSTQTPDSQRRRATPRQIARAVRRGSIPANLRPQPPMPQVSAPAPRQTVLSVETVDTPAERPVRIEAEEPGRRWGPALFLQDDVMDARQGGSGWVASLRERLPQRSPYSWRERDWRTDAWASRIRVLPIIAAALIALLVVGTFAYVVASRTASGAANRLHTVSSGNHAAPTSSSSGIILQQQQQTGEPTPAAPAYTIGTWVTVYGPASGGTEQVYVRVSNNDNPVAHVPVTLSVSWSGGASPYGPVLTDSYGLASFQVSVSAPPGQPELVTASATFGGSTITANTTFVPA